MRILNQDLNRLRQPNLLPFFWPTGDAIRAISVGINIIIFAPAMNVTSISDSLSVMRANAESVRVVRGR